MRLALALVVLLLAGCTSQPAPSGTTTVATTTPSTIATTPPTPSTTTTTTTPPTPPEPLPVDTHGESGLSCDRAAKTRFTADVTNVSNITHVMPLGNIAENGIVKSHGYVALKGDRNQPVFAPTDSTLFRLAWYLEAGEEQWLLFLQTDCNTWYVVDHLDNVSDKIRAAAPAAASNTTASNNLEIPVEIEAGEILGVAHPRGSGGSFDFGVYDATKNATFANASRERSSRDLHAVCPWEYYANGSSYTTKFARAGGAPVPNASCRSSSRDVAGTLAGQWRKGSTTLAVAADLDGSVVVSAPGVFLRHERGGQDPASVKPGAKVCYADPGAHVTIRVKTETTIELRYGGGMCPTEQEPPGDLWDR